MKNTVIYIGNFSFPLGNAAGKRVYANGKILKELGYKVIFIGVDKGVKKGDPLEATEKEYDGFAYYNFSYPESNLDWANYGKTFKNLERFLDDKNIIDNLALVIYYGSPTLSLFNTRLIRFCKKQNVKVIADCVDWLTVKTNSFMFDMVKWLDNNYQKAYANKKADGIIAISSYLSKYYGKYGCNTVIIPPLSPSDFRPSESTILNNNKKKSISYAGIPFRKGQQVKDISKLKDRIDKTIILFHEAKKSGCDFIFNIYGFTKDEYLKAIPQQKKIIDELGESIIFHGLKPNKEVVNSVIKSDFTILIRDVSRDTMAGFPTKVSESISCGTPVITTRTSDLEKFIIEDINGFFIDINVDNKVTQEKFNKILSFDSEKMKSMKKKCVESKIFYYKNYIYDLGSFIEDVK